MDIKLKTGSSVNIKDSSGTTICSVAEDGTISGISGGTKLYRHELTWGTFNFIFVSTDVSSYTYESLKDAYNNGNLIQMFALEDGKAYTILTMLFATDNEIVYAKTTPQLYVMVADIEDTITDTVIEL